MFTIRYSLFTIHLCLLLLFLPQLLTAQVVKVSVAKNENAWQIMRNNQPYYVKGAGGQTFLQTVGNIGGNSIRTWGLEQADEALAEAQKKGLTVMLGMWVQHERHGFDYNNKEAVKKQLDAFRKAVLKYKDHPSLLIWGVGNEVDLNYKNTKVWDAIQDIAKMIHELDPNHPTCTVTAGLDSAEVRLIKQKAPDIDIYGINTYGDIANVKQNLRKFGWNGPYIIAEWGPNGHWEVQKTSWNAAIEQTSFEKADSYYQRYTQCIQADSNYCVGSYVFLWGSKQEYTATWYGVFMKDGKSTEVIDAIEHAWTGKKSAQPASKLLNFTLNGKKGKDNIQLKAQEMNEAAVDIRFEGKGMLVYNWTILKESEDKKEGGDAEKEAEEILGLFRNTGQAEVKFRAPAEPGQYRIFVVVSNKGKAAYGNIPFKVVAREKNDPPAYIVQPKVYDMSSFSTAE
ncbi:MAG: glycoside hydrolase family 2 TIM barrel-domain containing protein [Bacteroidia bacterium]